MSAPRVPLGTIIRLSLGGNNPYLSAEAGPVGLHSCSCHFAFKAPVAWLLVGEADMFNSAYWSRTDAEVELPADVFQARVGLRALSRVPGYRHPGWSLESLQ